jgi:hypothetical protein
MDFIDIGVKIRFFYPKEVVPGSSRCNATGYYFSTWVLVKHTFPVEISTPAVLKAFLDASSGPAFALQHVTELDMDGPTTTNLCKEKRGEVFASVGRSY